MTTRKTLSPKTVSTYQNLKIFSYETSLRRSKIAAIIFCYRLLALDEALFAPPKLLLHVLDTANIVPPEHAVASALKLVEDSCRD